MPAPYARHSMQRSRAGCLPVTKARCRSGCAYATHFAITPRARQPEFCCFAAVCFCCAAPPCQEVASARSMPPRLAAFSARAPLFLPFARCRVRGAAAFARFCCAARAPRAALPRRCALVEPHAARYMACVREGERRAVFCATRAKRGVTVSRARAAHAAHATALERARRAPPASAKRRRARAKARAAATRAKPPNDIETLIPIFNILHDMISIVDMRGR